MEAGNGDSLAEIEARAVEMVRQAGQIALARFHRPLQVEFKQANRSDPVTEADREVEAFLRQAITELFPSHGILGEEGTEVDLDGREYLWVLDPVDGTNNYFNGLPLFGCSAGLLLRGEPVVGAIFLPVTPRVLDGGAGKSEGVASATPDISRGAVLHARLGGGACLDGRPVRASREPAPESSSLSGLPGHHFHQFLRLKEMRKNPGELRSLGSVCYE
ncbi:MAG TPA: inositol monophosphatase, partial [Chloroflexota bacterium]|nr:inositol monophosphatase [Chloroflexota bacterium]